MESSGKTARTTLLINRNFALLWGAQAISLIGDNAFDTTLVLWIVSVLAYKETWAPMAVSASSAMVMIPTLCIGPLAGVFVDRWNKRHTMLQMDLYRAVLVSILVLVSGIIPLPFLQEAQLHHTQLAILLIIVFATTICTQFFGPSRTSILAEIVPEAEQGRASGMFQTTSSLAVVLGPLVATPVFFALGVQATLIFNAFSFLLSFILLLAIKIPTENAQTTSTGTDNKVHFWQEFKEGITFTAHNQLLMMIIITIVLSAIGSGAIETLLVFFLSDNLHAPTDLYFYLTTGLGLGSIVGAILSSFIVKRVGVTRLYWIALIVSSILLMAFAHSSNLNVATVLLFAAGLASSSLNVAILPLILHITPHQLIGRVIAIFNPLQSAALLISYSLAGTLASTILLHLRIDLGPLHFGRIDTIYSASAILLFAAGIYAMIKLRHIDMERKEA